MGLFGKTTKSGKLDLRRTANKGFEGLLRDAGNKAVNSAVHNIVESFNDSSNRSSSSSSFMDNVTGGNVDEVTSASYLEESGHRITNLKLPEDEKSVIQYLEELISLIGLNGWGATFVKEDKPLELINRKNGISDSALGKMEIGVLKLKSIESLYYIHYSGKYKSLRRKRFFSKYGLILFVIVFIGVVGIWAIGSK